MLSVLCLQKKRKSNPIDRDDQAKKQNTAEMVAGLSEFDDEDQEKEEQIVSTFLKSDDDCNSRCVRHHDSVWFVCV